MTITQNALDLIALVHPLLDIRDDPPPGPGLPASDIWWPSLETCSNNEPFMVAKQAVRILLECFLVYVVKLPCFF